MDTTTAAGCNRNGYIGSLLKFFVNPYATADVRSKGGYQNVSECEWERFEHVLSFFLFFLSSGPNRPI